MQVILDYFTRSQVIKIAAFQEISCHMSEQCFFFLFFSWIYNVDTSFNLSLSIKMIICQNMRWLYQKDQNDISFLFYWSSVKFSHYFQAVLYQKEHTQWCVLFCLILNFMHIFFFNFLFSVFFFTKVRTFTQWNMSKPNPA